MGKTSFAKIIELVDKTGDTCVVLNAAGEPAYVILPFRSYERLTFGTSDVVGMTENELLEKINRDIALWKSGQEMADEPTGWPPEIFSADRPEASDEKSLNKANFSPKDANESQRYYFEPID